ncbi:MAG: biotin--[acetyl-CoA-carboxylase] ligase [Ferrimicrobium sp.]|jgi:BirA family biotin operon repressor/biotin-[acetyl-CoA-carboxylase] ligase|uniref:biotin--[biotin carboxyl-carrier protein] ligase n=1 Tax=Ferrimicrobium acidiphilum TaxID=121039 RepID=A0ABV3Y127_9ACTN|nr:biotin--[acetyl-CoA-carboxylase] ligase [Ferrimicrobium sp.]
MANSTPWRIILLDEIDSTNRVMTELLSSISLERLVLVADHQVDGRGRRDRSFNDIPKTALMCSILVRLSTQDAINLLPLAVGNAAVAAARSLGARDVSLKWPNDIEVHGTKLGGILVDGVFDRRGYLGVVGLGLNLIAAPQLPNSRRVGRLVDFVGPLVDRDFFALRDAYLALYLSELDSQLAFLVGGGGDIVLRSYRQLCSTIHQRVRIQYPGHEMLGFATGVDEDGRLVVSTPAGELALYVGDVEHLGVLGE